MVSADGPDLATPPRLCHDRDVTTDDSSTPATSSQTSQRDRISKRVGSIQPSATLAVDATAKALKAAGRPVIGFGAGEPDFPTPQHIVDAAIEAAQDPSTHRYSATGGLPELRSALAEAFTGTTGLDIDPAQVLVTNGGKQAVFQAFATLLDPGDEVILPAPYWTTYPEAIRQAGAVEVPVLAGVEQDYIPTVDQPRGGPHRAHPRAGAVLTLEPGPVRSSRPTRSPRSAAGRSSTASGWSPTRSTSP